MRFVSMPRFALSLTAALCFCLSPVAQAASAQAPAHESTIPEGAVSGHRAFDFDTIDNNQDTMLSYGEWVRWFSQDDTTAAPAPRCSIL